MIDRFEIRARGPKTLARELSGGNGDTKALRHRLERMESLLESTRGRELEGAGDPEDGDDRA